jgi:sugar lactone lactonase YvrE
MVGVKNFLLPLLLIGCALSGATTAQAQSNYQPYSFTTFAGIAPNDNSGANGTGSAARFFSPNGVTVDGAGNVYVADTYNSTIRKITPSGVVSTLAGLAGSEGTADGTGCAARFGAFVHFGDTRFGPAGVAVDSAGNVYVADWGNSTIRKITPSGVVSTFAGLARSSGSADGAGSDARFGFPKGVAVDSAGNVYVADSGNDTIRKITPSGVVSTLAGSASGSGSDDGTGSAARFYSPEGVAVDSAGNVYVADRFNFTIRKITSAGVVSTLAGLARSEGSADGTGSAARFSSPQGVAVDGAGNVYVADTGNSTIRKITPSGVVSTLAGLTGSNGSADDTGSAARFNSPQGVAVDSAGNAYVGDTGNNTIRKITPSRVVSTLAGLAASSGSADGTGSAARFSFPNGVTVDSAGNVYVADPLNDTIRKITPSGVVSTLAGLARISGSDDGTGSAARFNSPEGVAVDSAGNVYVADRDNNTVRRINPSGVVSTLAGLAGSPGSEDGIGSIARFNFPVGVAVDSAGNVYVADAGNYTIRMITPAGVVSTFAGLAGSPGSADGTGSAARFSSPEGLAVDIAGNVYVADTGNHTIRKITPAGVVSTLAGIAGSEGSDDGTGSAARFSFPFGVAVDSTGNAYVADTGSPFSEYGETIRKITSAGVVSTLAGLAGIYGSADGTGSAARFSDPRGVAVDSAGIVYVADASNNTIRVGVTAPPLITTLGQPFVYQLNTTSATSVVVSNPPPGLNHDPERDGIVGVSAVAGTFQVGISATYPAFPTVVTNSTLTITVQPVPASGPVISNGTSATGRVGRPFNFQVFTTGGTSAARLSANGLPPGLSVDPVTGIISGSAVGKGSSIATLTVTDGSFAAIATLQLTFTADTAVPVIISPGYASLTPNEFFTYTIKVSEACGSPDVTTFSFAGALPAGLSFDAATGTISGTYTGPLRASSNGGLPDPDQTGGIVLGGIQLFGTSSQGTGTLPLLFLPKPTGAVNIASRLLAGTGENVLIGGFIITGDAPKVVLVRAVGPSLTNVGVPNALQDPTLKLQDSTGNIIVNDNWQSDQEQVIRDTSLSPQSALESAIIRGLYPGNYTAIVEGKNGATGTALVEIYDLGTALLGNSGRAKLGNIATRGFAGNGDNVLIGGFIVQSVATRMVVRGIGPSLSAFGVSGALLDPTLEIKNASGTTRIGNDDWQQGQPAELQKAGLAPSDSHESALLTTLQPGQFTAIVSGKGGTTGVATVEVYALQ